tara:strand:+ start:971 stop:2338 length:1368 start_codon:yes stop_codon:yes gene_type:complete
MSQTQSISNTEQSMDNFTRESVSSNSNIRLCDSTADNSLSLFCYNKCTTEDTDLVKNCRGVIFNNDTLVFKGFPYTPEFPSEEMSKFTELFEDDFQNYEFYDSYEGALLRVFNWSDKWYVTTNRKIDAFHSKWSSKDSFGQMFRNAVEFQYRQEGSDIRRNIGECEESEVYEKFFDTLDKTYQYMFIVCNTFDNRIVCSASETPVVYHVGTFKDCGEQFSMNETCGFPYPVRHRFESFDDVEKYVNDSGFERIQGVVAYGPRNFQVKLLNNDYYNLFNARGNEPSIKFRYLQVRMDEKQTNMLYFLYPRFADTFDEYENSLYEIAQQINSNYIRRFIKKKYVTVPKDEYVVMKACHSWHLEDRDRNRISLRKVIDLLNEQSPTSLNHMIRHHKLNSKKEAKRPRAKSDLDTINPDDFEATESAVNPPSPVHEHPQVEQSDNTSTEGNAQSSEQGN